MQQASSFGKAPVALTALVKADWTLGELREFFRIGD